MPSSIVITCRDSLIHVELLPLRSQFGSKAVLVIAGHFASTMLSKAARPYDPEELPPEKRLRRNLQDLLANNVISGSRAQELFNDAAAAGDRNCRPLTRHGPLSHHAARDVRRRLLKHTMWPSLYEANIRCWNTKRQEEDVRKMWFLLPHEVLAVMHRIGSEAMLRDRAGFDPLTLRHLVKCEAAAGCQLLGIGIWGDGAPCNSDRTESIEVLSWNLPGQSGTWKNMRMPITAMSKKHVATSSTYADIFSVIVWSLESMATGRYPQQRHDGQAWLPSDVARRKLSSSLHLPFRAALVEVRGIGNSTRRCSTFLPGTTSPASAGFALASQTRCGMCQSRRLGGPPDAPIGR